MLSIALAFASAVSWGTGDFLGGLAARRYALLYVLAAASTAGLLLGTTVALISGQTFPPADEVALASASGVCGLIALAAFYNALAIGTMSIVAPISAAGTVIPVAWGLAHGEHLSAVAFTAIVVLMAGVMLASREQDAAAEHTAPVDHRRSVLMALVAAVGFGTVVVLIAESSDTSTIWPSAILKFTSLLIVLTIIAVRRKKIDGVMPTGRGWLFPAVVGTFDVTANMAYAAASQEGPIAIASVVSSMYPVMTVLLAFAFLHERLARSQLVGVAMALTGVIVLAAV